jgi:hypothetical protein
MQIPAMSGDKYIIADQHACYFLTFTVIHWIDVFTPILSGILKDLHPKKFQAL